MRTLILAAGLSATLLSMPVVAQEDNGSGNWLLRACSQKDIGGVQAAYDTGLCHGFIIGVGRGVSDNSCFDGVEVQQTVDVIVKYLQNNPEFRHVDAAFLARVAMAQGFGCPPPE
jgi:hypothetical protein